MIIGFLANYTNLRFQKKIGPIKFGFVLNFLFTVFFLASPLKITAEFAWIPLIIVNSFLSSSFMTLEHCQLHVFQCLFLAVGAFFKLIYILFDWNAPWLNLSVLALSMLTMVVQACTHSESWPTTLFLILQSLAVSLEGPLGISISSSFGFIVLNSLLSNQPAFSSMLPTSSTEDKRVIRKSVFPEYLRMTSVLTLMVGVSLFGWRDFVEITAPKPGVSSFLCGDQSKLFGLVTSILASISLLIFCLFCWIKQCHLRVPGFNVWDLSLSTIGFMQPLGAYMLSKVPYNESWLLIGTGMARYWVFLLLPYGAASLILLLSSFIKP